MYRYRLYCHYLSIQSLVYSYHLPAELHEYTRWTTADVVWMRSSESHDRKSCPFKECDVWRKSQEIFSNYALCKSNNYYQTCRLCKKTLPLMGFPSPNLKMFATKPPFVFIGCPSATATRICFAFARNSPVWMRRQDTKLIRSCHPRMTHGRSWQMMTCK